MAITLSGTRITVRFEGGDPKGDSWNDPFTLDDVVDAIANVTKQGKQIYIPYSLYIEGADTYFLAEDMQVCFGDVELDDNYALSVNANFKSQGNIKGMQWIDDGNNRLYLENNIEIINTLFGNFQYAFFKDCSISRTKFINIDNPYMPYNTAVILDNVTFANAKYGFYPFYDFSSAENININNCERGIFLSNSSFNGTKIKFKDNTYDLYIRPISPNTIINLTDSQIDVTAYIIGLGYTGDITVNLISTFKINIENGDGASAKLYDQNDNLIWTETLSGELEKAVTYFRRYVETDGSLVEDTATTYEPFKLVISKAGSPDLTIPDITIEPGEETRIFAKFANYVYKDRSIAGSISQTELSGSIEVIELAGSI